MITKIKIKYILEIKFILIVKRFLKDFVRTFFKMFIFLQIKRENNINIIINSCKI